MEQVTVNSETLSQWKAEFRQQWLKEREQQWREQVEQRRKVTRPIKRKNRKIKITRTCCKECGQPKHYICLTHNSQKKKHWIYKIFTKPRYYFRKFYFGVARKLGFVD